MEETESVASWDEESCSEKEPWMVELDSARIQVDAAPYSLEKVLRGYGACRRGKRLHPGLDIAGVGPDAGLGTPIRSMVRARIKKLGLSADDPRQFGSVDRRRGLARRNGQALPRAMELPEYGLVRFFTRSAGTWRSGNIIVTEGLDGVLLGHEVRYMHLGAVHPDLHVGDIVEAGQEIGVMGGTAVQRDWPHVHIDVTDPEGERVDIGHLLGLGPVHESCYRPRPRPVALLKK